MHAGFFALRGICDVIKPRLHPYPRSSLRSRTTEKLRNVTKPRRVCVRGRKRTQSFSPATCTAEKIPLGSQTCALCACGVQCVRCSELQSLPTRTQRSGPRWGTLTRCCPDTCPHRAARAAPRPHPAGRRDTSHRATHRPCAAWSRPPCRRAAARPRSTARNTRT